jgi:hypothetical protein
MLRKINNFLNAVERFYKRLFVAVMATLLYPFWVILFIFGFLGLNIQQEDDEE